MVVHAGTPHAVVLSVYERLHSRLVEAVVLSACRVCVGRRSRAFCRGLKCVEGLTLTSSSVSSCFPSSRCLFTCLLRSPPHNVRNHSSERKPGLHEHGRGSGHRGNAPRAGVRLGQPSFDAGLLCTFRVLVKWSLVRQPQAVVPVPPRIVSVDGRRPRRR